MKKKILFYLLPLLGLTLTGCGPKEEEPSKPDDPSGPVKPVTPDDPVVPADTTVYDVTVQSSQGIVEKEAGFLHQLAYEDQVIDIVGFEAIENGVGAIKRKSYNGQVINGMIYNRSLMTYLDKLRIDFTGGDLQYIFTEFLMEDMDFDSKTNNKLVSGQPVSCPEGKGYFVVYTKSTTPVNVSAVMLKFKDQGFEANMIYNKNTSRGGARSNGIEKLVADSFIELENNPTQYTNNYSGSGKHDGHTNADSWYRWNGRYFTDSEDLGTDFTFGMTIAGEYSRFVDESKFFHYNVWPQFSWGGTYYDEYEGKDVPDEPWVQTYIGNDNYEPLGKDDAVNPSDPYVNESYAGRFYTNYDWYNDDWEIDYNDGTGDWIFGDPDQCKIPDGSKTFREAYNETKLPFWFLKFHVYLGQDNDAMCDISINGRVIYSTYIFDEYDTVNTPSIHLHTLPMHLINYGNPDGSVNDSLKYTGTFTYPRLIETNMQ